MPRRFLSLSIAILALFAVAAVAQTQTPATPTNGQPFGGPILSTPNVTFTTPAPEAGISDAGRAGISAGSTTETAPAAPAATAPDMTGASTAIVPAGTTMPAEAPTNDMGVSVSVNNPEAVSAPLSIAEAASRYKNEKAAVNAKNLSNDDVEQIIKNKDGVTIAGSGAPQNTFPAASDQTQAAEPQAPQTVQSSLAAAQPQTAATTQATADNATTPQINENQQSNDAQGSTRLPATATFLPLLGLMGLASSGFGLWVRKFRK